MGSLSSCSWVCGSPVVPWKDTLRGRARHSSFQKSDDGVWVGQGGDELHRDHHEAQPSPAPRRAGESFAGLGSPFPALGTQPRRGLCSCLAACLRTGRETGPTC